MIGVWFEGRLDAVPWQEQGHFQLVIDGVRYTVMNEVDVKLVTTEKDMVRVDPEQASGPGSGRCGPSLACVMRVQRDGIRLASRRASSARRNPPALDSRHPTYLCLFIEFRLQLML